MKLTYVTAYNSFDINKWSGFGYHIGQALKNQSISLEYIGSLKDNIIHRAVRKSKRHYYEIVEKKSYLINPEPLILKDYANQIQEKLSDVKTDVIFSPTINPITYLECEQPIVFWADATFAGLQNFYPHYSNLCDETINNWHLMETLALEKCKLAIYVSDWAAKTAIENYKADPAKVKVVPFGANLEINHTISEVKNFVEARPINKCKLLFLGVEWFRKGGNVAFEVTKALNQSGLSTELTVVGCEPIIYEPLPDYIKPLGFINKSTSEGKEKISKLLAESHFLILPSRAECFGVVFCEASSFGVPSLATNAGGIPTAVKDDINGKLFELNADISEYCNYISNLFANYSEYKKLALSAFNEYQSRLNWDVAGRTVKNLLIDCLDY